jgi:hypothetical protein
MEMFLMVVCISLFGLGVTCAAFGAATRPEQPPAEPQPECQPAVAAAPARFFADNVVIPPAPLHARVPIEAILLQIESHVRLEQAAAESFLEFPTATLLHSRTVSPFVN